MSSHVYIAHIHNHNSEKALGFNVILKIPNVEPQYAAKGGKLVENFFLSVSKTKPFFYLNIFIIQNIIDIFHSYDNFMIISVSFSITPQQQHS